MAQNPAETEDAMTADYRQRYGSWAPVLGCSEGLGRALAMELAARGMESPSPRDGRSRSISWRRGVVLCSSLAAAAGLHRWVSYGASKAMTGKPDMIRFAAQA